VGTGADGDALVLVFLGQMIYVTHFYTKFANSGQRFQVENMPSSKKVITRLMRKKVSQSKRLLCLKVFEAISVGPELCSPLTPRLIPQSCFYFGEPAHMRNKTTRDGPMRCCQNL